MKGILLDGPAELGVSRPQRWPLKTLQRFTAEKKKEGEKDEGQSEAERDPLDR